MILQTALGRVAAAGRARRLHGGLFARPRSRVVSGGGRSPSGRGARLGRRHGHGLQLGLQLRRHQGLPRSHRGAVGPRNLLALRRALPLRCRLLGPAGARNGRPQPRRHRAGRILEESVLTAADAGWNTLIRSPFHHVDDNVQISITLVSENCCDLSSG